MALLPLADEEAVRLLASLSEERRKECWWLVLRDGTPVPGDDGGGVALLRELRVTRPMGALLHSARISPVVDVFDKALSRSRKQLSKLVPDGPAPRRYP
ncbi:MAG: hypothetical protein HYU37_21705 [Acidobacteria bacterium]|nr:hypothetical protein [Acidobacteriota bacterium]